LAYPLNCYRFVNNIHPSVLSAPDRYGLLHQARISASVNAMRVLNTGTEVEAAVADALVGHLQAPPLSNGTLMCRDDVTGPNAAAKASY